MVGSTQQEGDFGPNCYRCASGKNYLGESLKLTY
jgi:hypothetical protein